VDDEDEAGLTPLHTAAELGSVSQAELLLERGAALDHASACGWLVSGLKCFRASACGWF
jgi:ankyrin repeat protein